MKSIVKVLIVLLPLLAGGCGDFSDADFFSRTGAGCERPEVNVSTEPDSIGLGDSVVIHWRTLGTRECRMYTYPSKRGGTFDFIRVESNGSRTFWPEANTDYRIVGYSVNGACTNENTAQVQIGPGRYILDTFSEGMGKVIRTPDSAAYFKGSQVDLTAIPDSGYRFVRWNVPGWSYGSVISFPPDNPLTLTVARHLTLLAIFTKYP